MDTATALLHHTAAFAKAATAGDPDAPVATCPEWPLRVLVGHVGQAHRWAAATVRGEPSPVPDPVDADPGAPATWPTWLHDGATELISAVSTCDRPVWTFFGDGPASFWLRRMLNDTIIHHADAAGAAFDVTPALAEDALGEWLDLLAHPVTATLRPDVLNLRGTGQTLLLAPADTLPWHITRTPEGIRWMRSAVPADVTVEGPIRDVLLVLTRRLPADEVTITGDRGLVDYWLDHTKA